MSDVPEVRLTGKAARFMQILQDFGHLDEEAAMRLLLDIEPSSLLGDDIADGPDAIDRDQLALAVEFVRDVGVYSEDDEVETLLAKDTAIGRLVDYVLEPGSSTKPAGPYAKAVSEWEQLERFVESRLRRE